MSSRELYIGNLDRDTKTHEIKDIFERYGNVSRCEVKFGLPAHSVAFGFVAFESSKNAERAQRKEHGRSHRGRRLIVEFTKTTAGQNGRRGRYSGGDEYMKNRYGHERDLSRLKNRNVSEAGFQRRRSPSYIQRLSADRNSDDDRRRKRHRSLLSHESKSSLKRNRSSSSDDDNNYTSHSRKNSKKH